MGGYETEAIQLEALAGRLRFQGDKTSYDLLMQAAQKLRRPHGHDTELMGAIVDLLRATKPAKISKHRKWWIRDYLLFDKAIDAFQRMFGPIEEISL